MIFFPEIGSNQREYYEFHDYLDYFLHFCRIDQPFLCYHIDFHRLNICLLANKLQIDIY